MIVLVRNATRIARLGLTFALLTGCAASATQATSPTATSIATLTPLPQIVAGTTLTALALITPTAAPFTIVTASPAANPTGSASGTPQNAVPGDPPPLVILLPAGWRATYTLAPTLDQGNPISINAAGYAGPLPAGGTGFIYILWNYPSLVPVNPAALPTNTGDLIQAQLYSDGQRFLQGTILDSACTVGNYGRQTFSIGGQSAVGQVFQSSQCPDGSPDVAGWYAGVDVQGQRLLFYAYIQPVNSFIAARPALQTILDGVTFHIKTVNTPASAATAVMSAGPPTATSISVPPTGTPVLN